MWIAIGLYYLEVIKYYIGNQVMFAGKSRKIWIPILGGLFYAVLLIKEQPMHDVLYLLAYMLAAVLSVAMIEGKWSIRLFRVLSLLCITACIDGAVGGMLFWKMGMEGAVDVRSVLESLTTLGVLGVVKIVQGKRKKLPDRGIRPTTKFVSVLAVCMVFALACAMRGLVYAKSFVPGGRLYFDIACVVVWLCVAGVGVVIAYIKNTNDKLEQLVETERELKGMQEKYYQTLLEKEESTRRYRHDMANHMLCLYEFAKKEKAAETGAYIEKLQHKLSDIQRKAYDTGDEVLNILFGYYAAQGDGIHIKVQGRCERPLHISNVDICSIFSNLIQNAVEETRRVAEENCHIQIEMKVGRQYLMVKVKNPSDLVLKPNAAYPKTKKADASNHGIGLRNIQDIIKANGGSFRLTGDGKEVVATVFLDYKRS